MNKKVSEEDILEVFVEKMKAEGLTLNSVTLNVDNSMVDKINNAKETNIDLEQLHELAKRCIANEWIIRLETNRSYNCFQLSTKGLGVINSRQIKEGILTKRTWLKKASDYIKDHEGLFGIGIGAIIAIAGLFFC